ncbi:MAG: hypothetical protein ACRBI6_00180 [Acidimicrobiales bacterium]
MVSTLERRSTPHEGADAPRPASTWLVALLGALPTLVAAFLAPEHLLDDVEFAAAARFEGLSGFFWEMRFRPGQGLVHAAQFLLLGGHASALLVVHGAVAGLVAVAWWRLLRLVVSPSLAIAATIAYLALPNRGSLRFWVSTLPNQLAILCVLSAAIVIARCWRRRPTGEVVVTTGEWMSVGALVLAAVMTYEGTLAVALVSVAALLWLDRRRWPFAVGVTAALGLFVVVSIAGRPTDLEVAFLAGGADALPSHLRSLEVPVVPALPVVAFLSSAIAAVVTLRRHLDRDQPPLDDPFVHAAVTVVVGAAVVAAGLAPFVAAGFNLQPFGVLDRGHAIAAFGDALVFGGGAVLVARWLAGRTLAAGSAGSRGLAVAVGWVLGGLVVAGAVGVADDLDDYVTASEVAREARATLATIDRPEPGGVVMIERPPVVNGVTWAYFVVQLRDEYQLVHDDPVVPEWLVWAPPPSD